MRIALSMMMVTSALCLSACSAEGGSVTAGGADAGASSADGAVAGGDEGPAEDQAADDDSSGDESGWWRTDASEAPDSLQGEEGPDKGGALTVTWAGMVNIDTQEGGVTVQVTETETETLLCEFTQSVNALAPSDTACEACAFSWLVSFEEATLTTGDAGECLEGSWVMTARNLGHGEGDMLYHGDKAAGWTASGTSTFADPVWMFNMSYAPSTDTGDKDDDGKGDGASEDCMQGCLDKGGNQGECAAHCGDAGEGGDVDEACFDECIGKGGDEAECAAYCGDAGEGGDGQIEGEDCPDGFDPSQPCEGSAVETACVVDGEWFWCEGGAWTNEK